MLPEGTPHVDSFAQSPIVLVAGRGRSRRRPKTFSLRSLVPTCVKPALGRQTSTSSVCVLRGMIPAMDADLPAPPDPAPETASFTFSPIFPGDSVLTMRLSKNKKLTDRTIISIRSSMGLAAVQCEGVSCRTIKSHPCARSARRELPRRCTPNIYRRAEPPKANPKTLGVSWRLGGKIWIP